MCDRSRVLSRRRAATVVASGVGALLSACGTGGAASPQAIAPSATRSFSNVGVHKSSSASGSSAPASAGGAAVSSLPTYDPDQITVNQPAKPGGSSVQVESPCDGGTATLRAYPDGEGVAATATLRNTTDSTWGTYAYITPDLDLGDQPPLTQLTAHDGVLVVDASNLTGPEAVGGYSHAWPQSAWVDMYSKLKNVDCSMGAYLDSSRAGGTSPELELDILQSGTVTVSDGTPPAGGTWQVSITVRSPAGARHQTRSVAAVTESYPPMSPHFSTAFHGLANLQDFTSVTVTASKDGAHRTWITVSRRGRGTQVLGSRVRSRR